jgi:oxygen-independent coproporphyrinogen-3 oxidase
MKIREPEFLKAYMNALKKELTIFRKHISTDRKVSQVHWGGGTPNALPSEMIRDIMDQIRTNFNFIENPEIAIECNPAGLSNDYIDVLEESGFNRISLGIQDFSTRVLDAVNRDVSERPIEEITDYIRSKNIKFNLDFIYGLPYQDVNSFKSTIEKAINLNPDRLVTFSYAHVPWVKPAQKRLEDHGLPGPDEKTEMFEAAAELLHNAGYKSIGLDHYAREDDDLWISLNNRKLHRNFQGYCTRETTGQVYAVGISSISQLYDSYSQNTKNINKYIESLEAGVLPVEKGYSLNRQEVITRDVINELMCNFYLDPKEIAVKNQVPLSGLKTIMGWDLSILQELEEDQLITLNKEKLEIRERGKFFIRNVAAVFDPLQKVDSGRKFSKSV